MSNILHQVGDVRTFVIASYVGVEILPGTLDLVVVRAIGRKKVECKTLASLGGQGSGNFFGTVDGIFVQDHVDLFGVRVSFVQLPEELNEKQTVLAITLNPDQFTRFCI